MFTEFKHYKIIYLPGSFCSRLLMVVNFQEAIKSGLSKHSGRLFIRPILVCLLTIGILCFELLLKKDSCSYRLCNYWTFKVNLMNDQVSSLQRNRLAANLHWPFYRVRSNCRRIPMNAFQEQHFNSARDPYSQSSGRPRRGRLRRPLDEWGFAQPQKISKNSHSFSWCTVYLRRRR